MGLCVREISDINQAWIKWKNTFLAAARDTIPLLVWKPGQRKSWLTMDTRKLIKKGLSKGQKDKIRLTLDSMPRYQQLCVAAN